MDMISKSNAKFLKSLQIKKYRKEHSCFLVEGTKSVNELLTSKFEVVTLYATKLFLDEFAELWRGVDVEEVTSKELGSVSFFQTNNSVLAVVKTSDVKFKLPPENKLSIALDSVNDPGNLGTIIRVADWYGITDIYCSLDTVDVYNPKVISSTKGSINRVNVHYCDLFETLNTAGLTIYGAFLEGNNIHDLKLKGDLEGILLMGSEAHGVSSELEVLVTSKVTIPSFGDTESLNVSIATAIICDNLKRLSV